MRKSEEKKKPREKPSKGETYSHLGAALNEALRDEAWLKKVRASGL